MLNDFLLCNRGSVSNTHLKWLPTLGNQQQNLSPLNFCNWWSVNHRAPVNDRLTSHDFLSHFTWPCSCILGLLCFGFGLCPGSQHTGGFFVMLPVSPQRKAPPTIQHMLCGAYHSLLLIPSMGELLLNLWPGCLCIFLWVSTHQCARLLLSSSWDHYLSLQGDWALWLLSVQSDLLVRATWPPTLVPVTTNSLMVPS